MSTARDQALQALTTTDWDIVVIGGGITGAGILLEACRRGYKALLVEQRDFAWGTSSRSSKLVHGGLRYLKEGQLRLTRDSVHERERLLRQARGLVSPQGFAFALYRGCPPGRRTFELGLAVYDRLAGQAQLKGLRHHYPADEFLLLAPHIRTEGLQGGLCYQDAKTDDARLVLRVLQEAQALGGVALNYLAVRQLLRTGDAAGGVANGAVCGVRVQDAATGADAAPSWDVRARLVVNATGAWADRLRAHQGVAPRLRPLRGSHLVLPAWRLPVAQAISLMHPEDGRPVFAFPWEGASLVGTTDVDHRSPLEQEPRITAQELRYLLAALDHQFPALRITQDDVIATYAGVRPVIDTGKADPSQESRDHAVWLEQGLLTVTGGKLTTFELIARDALDQVVAHLPTATPPVNAAAAWGCSPALDHCAAAALSAPQRQRLLGRLGTLADAAFQAAQPGELDTIAGTETLWLELRWAARAEAVLHLDDLLLRRTRIGLLLRGGGMDHVERIRSICQSELGWSDVRWQQEASDYRALWQAHYSLPQASTASQASDTGERP